MFAAAVLSATSRMIMFLLVMLTHIRHLPVCLLIHVYWIKVTILVPTDGAVLMLLDSDLFINSCICLLKLLVILFLLYVSTWLNFWQRINTSCPDQVGKQHYRMFHGKPQDEQLCEKVTAYRWTDIKCTFGRYVLVMEVGFSWPRKAIESIQVSMCSVLWIMCTVQLVSEVKSTTTLFMLVAI